MPASASRGAGAGVAASSTSASSARADSRTGLMAKPGAGHAMGVPCTTRPKSVLTGSLRSVGMRTGNITVATSPGATSRSRGRGASCADQMASSHRPLGPPVLIQVACAGQVSSPTLRKRAHTSARSPGRSAPGAETSTSSAA